MLSSTAIQASVIQVSSISELRLLNVLSIDLKQCLENHINFLKFLAAVNDLEETSCIEGIVSYEFETGDVLFDNTKETTCEFGQTKCYKATMTATVGNYPSMYFFSNNSLKRIMYLAGLQHNSLPYVIFDK